MRRLYVAATLAIVAAISSTPSAADDDYLNRLRSDRHVESAKRIVFGGSRDGDEIMSRTDAIRVLINACRNTRQLGLFAADREAAEACNGPIALLGAELHAEDVRRAGMPHNDPSAISLCPPPHRMTRDGCQ